MQAQRNPTQQSSPYGQHDSLHTYVGDLSSNGSKYAGVVSTTHTNAESGGPGAYANNGMQGLGNGNGLDREGSARGETTLAGDPQNGVPLGRRL